MQLLYLFFTFFKIGLFSIGGGLATLPFYMSLPQKATGYPLPIYPILSPYPNPHRGLWE